MAEFRQLFQCLALVWLSTPDALGKVLPGAVGVFRQDK